MGTGVLLLSIPSGTFELRKASLLGHAQSPSITAPRSHIESGLRSALWSQRMAMVELLGPGRVTPSMLTDPDALIRQLLLAVEMGGLELALPNDGQREATADDLAWNAFLAFQAQVGREFTVAARSHRLVPRERVDAVKREREYDVVAAPEATAIVGTVAKSKASGSLAPHLKTLLASICDMRGPSNQNGFVLLRAPATQAARYVAPEDVITPAKLRELKREKERGTHELDLQYETTTGHVITDDEGFLLVWPDGREEEATLQNGRLQRKSVDPGEYEVRVRAIRKADWATASAYPFDEITLFVEAQGFPEGTAVAFRIIHAWDPPEAPPVYEAEAALKGGRAQIQWKHTQAVGESPYAEYQFRATIGAKWAWSSSIVINAHAPGEVRGAQERLRALGHDPGPPTDEMTPPLREAVKAFQQGYPPLPVSGVLDEHTLDILDDIIP